MTMPRRSRGAMPAGPIRAGAITSRPQFNRLWMLLSSTSTIFTSDGAADCPRQGSHRARRAAPHDRGFQATAAATIVHGLQGVRNSLGRRQCPVSKAPWQFNAINRKLRRAIRYKYPVGAGPILSIPSNLPASGICLLTLYNPSRHALTGAAPPSTLRPKIHRFDACGKPRMP